MARNVLIYLAVIGCMLACTGLFVFLFANSTEVQCVREAGREPDCRITKKFLGQTQISNRDVLGVTSVRMNESCDEDGCSYRAELVTSTGRSVPVNDVYTDRGTVARQIDAFAGFLDGTDDSFEYVQPVAWWVVIMLVGMDLVAFGFVAAHFLRSMRGGRT